MGQYVPTGNFVDGSAPGISAAFLNNLEGFIQQLEGDAGGVTINGGTSGTAIGYQMLQGTMKMVQVIENNFRTAGSNQDLTLPVAFVAQVYVISSGTVTFNLLSGGTPQTINVLTALASGGGSSTPITDMGSNSFGNVNGAVNAIRFKSGAASAHTGSLILFGY